MKGVCTAGGCRDAPHTELYMCAPQHSFSKLRIVIQVSRNMELSTVSSCTGCMVCVEHSEQAGTITMNGVWRKGRVLIEVGERDALASLHEWHDSRAPGT